MAIQENKSVLTSIEGTKAIVTINRPESLNALNPDVLVSLIQAFDDIKKNSDLRSVIITGAGEKSFVAGADIASMSGLGPRAIADYVELGQRTMRIIETFHLPVIAAVNGFALGGGLELALACDLIYAADSAKVGQPEVNLGILPGFGGTQRLVTRCGVGTAKRLCYTGEIISADEAYKLHIVDKVISKTELIDEVKKLCDLIASKAPLAVSSTKAVINSAIEQQMLSGLQREVEAFLNLFGSKDREEGMQAFLQKRSPNFTGK
jgi:enoyl-CoA hydratase